MKYEIEPSEAFLFDGRQWCYRQDKTLVYLTPSRKHEGFWDFQFVEIGTWDALQTINPAKPWWCAHALKSKGVELMPGLWEASDLADVGRSDDCSVKQPPIESGSIVYAVRSGEFVKLGTTTDLANRMLGLQCGNPITLSIIGTWPGDIRHEGEAHRRFAHLRVRGEWFSVTADLLAFIEESASCKV